VDCSCCIYVGDVERRPRPRRRDRAGWYGGVQGAARSPDPRIDQTTGHHVTVWLSTGPAVPNRINSGAPCDVMAVNSFQVDALVKSGAVEAGSSATMGNLTVDLAYPVESPKPDI
jgi:hypothetical protein